MSYIVFVILIAVVEGEADDVVLCVGDVELQAVGRLEGGGITAPALLWLCSKQMLCLSEAPAACPADLLGEGGRFGVFVVLDGGGAVLAVAGEVDKQ